MIDTQRIIDEITQLDVSPVAKESGAALVDSWIQLNQQDLTKKVVAVETGFVVWLDEVTAVIGVQDLLTDEDGIVGNEWKTTKGKTKFWNEDAWYESIKEGSQVAIYALALNAGTYYEKRFENLGGLSITPKIAVPRIRVRAIAKSEPAVMWRGQNDGILTFTEEDMANTRRALLAKAASIRAMRRANVTPWQLPGLWCENKFRRICEHYSDCVNKRIPPGYGIFDPDDPAHTLALGNIHPDQLTNPDLVILGASMYSAVSECAEKYRRGTLKQRTESTPELEIGTVLHQGAAEWYRQIRAEQLIIPLTQ